MKLVCCRTEICNPGSIFREKLIISTYISSPLKADIKLLINFTDLVSNEVP